MIASFRTLSDNYGSAMLMLKWSHSDLMESLDASYALLSDANARNRELQARLRSSLPLLWTNNALVMTSAAAPRRRRIAEQSGDSEADQMLLALEGHASLQVSRRYKRRVEWEVARRIARVDRELQQYPPSRRFWNQKRKESTPFQSSSYKQRVKERRVGTAGKKDGDVRQKQVAMTTGRTSGKTDHQEKKFWVKPKVTMETSGEGRVVKHVATSPLRGGEGGIDDKENMKPNAAIKTQFEEHLETIDTKESTVWKDTTETKKVASEPLDDLSVPENGKDESNRDEPVDVHETTGSEASIQAGEVKLASPRPVPSSPVGTIAVVHDDSNHDNAFAIEENSPRIRTPVAERPSSSIGRQVLSEFRTMPSVASFGAQPMLSAGGLGKPGDMRLNVDVLRRLFSDLDTDKDGHVNRIETCMALHRLQISVPTTKIISFFRHIHSSTDGKSVRSRRTQHLPMNEVINYKEFVAFVTAAYDQQQQRKAQRNRPPTRRQVWKENHDTAPPLPVPSMSLPIYAHPTSSPRAPRYVHAPPPPPREQQVRTYEVDDTGSQQLEERVIQEIPDFLVSRILADTSSAASVEANANAESVVRKSLESLVGKEAIGDKIVNEITQELIRERLRTIGTLTQDDTEDVTGLKRAAAYYNEQMMLGDAESCPVADDSSSDNLVNWVDVLTEEQVSGLVQQIWKDKQATLHHAPLEPVEDVHIEDIPEMPEDQSVRWRDEATYTDGLTVPITLSEKAIQAFDGDNQEELVSTEDVVVPLGENQDDAFVPIPAVSDSTGHPRTDLARALTISLGASGESVHELFNPVTSIGVLQHLRQQRRMNKGMFNIYQAHSCMDEEIQPGEEANDAQIHPLDLASVLTSEVRSESISSRSMERETPAEEQGLMPIPTTAFVPLSQKMLDLDDYASNESSSELAKSVSVSSSGFSSASNYHVYGMYREIDRHQLHARTRSIRRRRPYRRQRRLSVSGSSVPDSNWSAELSEGELSREGLNLSDGEIFGECKKEYVRHKNKASNVMESKSDDDNLHSSVESGELPALMKTHANFRHQLVVQSISSVESGEHEDGTVPT